MKGRKKEKRSKKKRSGNSGGKLKVRRVSYNQKETPHGGEISWDRKGLWGD